YESSDLRQLTCAVKDVQAVKNALVGEGGFDASNVHVLTGANATRKRVLREFAFFAKAMERCRRQGGEAKTRFLFYFAGHGLPAVRGGRNDMVLAVHDTDPEIDYTSIYTSIGAAELEDGFAAIGADQTLLVCDCCHAGAMGAGARGDRAEL